MASATTRTAVTLRSASADECPALSGLCLRSKGHWGYDAAFLEACREELTIRPDETGDLLCVAEVDGEASGIAQIALVGDDWHVDKLFVDPPFIGKGVGAMLMRWMIDTARAKGAVRLVIEADPGAAAFYRRFGARDAGKAASGSIPGRLIPRLVMEIAAD